jgi:hypothetical protein
MMGGAQHNVKFHEPHQPSPSPADREVAADIPTLSVATDLTPPPIEMGRRA